MTMQKKNAISIEKEVSQQFYLDTYEDGFVALSLRNVAMVEAFISYDSNYLRTENEDAKKTNSFPGSTAFWMSLLRRLCIVIKN
ncbi:MAG: hypothetical protein IJ151_07590 [Bacteroidales bacterium]|nr:hypothetical protein [Bacteroidales bacterium]